MYKDFIKESSAACGIPPTNNTTSYRVNSTVVFAFALVFFALRIVTKFRLGLTWGIDDTLTTLSVVSHLPCAVGRVLTVIGSYDSLLYRAADQ